ncbi:RodZ family helix-turn-helix domain-containing protein [Pontibacillus sp. HMF3514]|uniref:helix-turn-helix domain-containing protein n=1 Tax=Pontibacillus sp. HMF3514 TaxID=2692425 RepID=UPI00131F97DF|nr:RodZ domain-containing protein [Pontibacillus sp. HMF3514]QHE52259.1 helix-turn-helix domain-containing protein [Pontibacillus sp. HMF3514]
MEIGARLKEAREAKNMSLDDVQNETKIQTRYLQAIEKGNFSIMPGKFYTRAFIRQYAEAVGLDPDLIMEEHANELPSSSEEEYIQYTRLQRHKDETSTKGSAIFTFLPKFIIGLLVIGILVVGYIFYQKTIDSNPADTPAQDEDGVSDEVFRDEDGDSGNSDSSGDSSEGDQNNSDQTNENNGEDNQGDTQETQEPEEPKQEINVVEKGSGAEPESTLELVNADELKFRAEIIQENDESFLGVRNGKGKEFFGKILNSDTPEMSLDLTGEERIRIRVGRANQTNIFINDQKLEYPVNPEENIVQTIWINVKGSSVQ